MMPFLIEPNTAVLLNVLSTVHLDDDSLYPLLIHPDTLDTHNYMFETYLSLKPVENDIELTLKSPNIELIILSDTVPKLIEKSKTWADAYFAVCVNASQHKNATLRPRPLGPHPFIQLVNEYYPEFSKRFDSQNGAIWEG